MSNTSESSKSHRKWNIQSLMIMIADRGKYTLFDSCFYVPNYN